MQTAVPVCETHLLPFRLCQYVIHLKESYFFCFFCDFIFAVVCINIQQGGFNILKTQLKVCIECYLKNLKEVLQAVHTYL